MSWSTWKAVCFASVSIAALVGQGAWAQDDGCNTTSDPETALAKCTALIKRGKIVVHYYEYRAKILVNLKRYDEAISDFTEAIKILAKRRDSNTYEWIKRSDAADIWWLQLQRGMAYSKKGVTAHPCAAV